MKFTLALIATASAVTISRRAMETCVSEAQSDRVFDLADVNGDGKIGRSELTSAITTYLDSTGMKVTRRQIKAFTNTAEHDSGADGVLEKSEFNHLANQVANYLAPTNCLA